MDYLLQQTEKMPLHQPEKGPRTIKRKIKIERWKNKWSEKRYNLKYRFRWTCEMDYNGEEKKIEYDI